jgi:chloramphenicol 3-O phosphotransferase
LRPVILQGMEPRPADRGPGRIIFLNGASSSGKSTLAKAMQAALGEPFLHVSSDLLVASGMLPARRDPAGPFAWWEQMRPRFFAGFHRCLPALAAAGNDLIVEHIIEFRAWRADLARLLDGLDVFLVGVHCDLAEIDRRERDRRGPVSRGDRPDPYLRPVRLRCRHDARDIRRADRLRAGRMAGPRPPASPAGQRT